ncbi:hypothetical protein Zmor_010320 [Zophobas morio]|uniref:Uncharacterized protein n=1 Tax=Zophobas morio TaxID=2755281 RepID=A0AA38IKH1_9CUCU|nr:hypothetical protein Zmor_010320 [Zophobas morio]
MDKAGADNRANQLNPNHPSYMGGTVTHGYNDQKCYRDNRANQLNPNNPAYWKSRSGQEAASEGWGCNIV